MDNVITTEELQKSGYTVVADKTTGKKKSLPWLHLAKFIAIVGMVLVHTFEACEEIGENIYDINNIEEWFVEFFGSVPSGVLFMVAMGIGVSLSRKATPQKYMHRAIQIFLLGILVNVFEKWLPFLYADPSFLLHPASEQFASIIATDIYSFATLCMLFFGFLVSTRNPIRVACISLVLACCAWAYLYQFVENFTTGSWWLDNIIGIFLRLNEYSYFSFFPWIIWPLVGFLFGKLWVTHPDTIKRGGRVFLAGLVAMVIGTVLSICFDSIDAVKGKDIEPIDDVYYYSMDGFNLIMAFGLVSMELAILQAGTEFWGWRIHRIVEFSSKHIMAIYVFQWMLIGLSTPILLCVDNDWVSLLLGIIIFILTLVCTQLWVRFRTSRKEKANA